MLFVRVRGLGGNLLLFEVVVACLKLSGWGSDSVRMSAISFHILVYYILWPVQ